MEGRRSSSRLSSLKVVKPTPPLKMRKKWTRRQIKQEGGEEDVSLNGSEIKSETTTTTESERPRLILKISKSTVSSDVSPLNFSSSSIENSDEGATKSVSTKNSPKNANKNNNKTATQTETVTPPQKKPLGRPRKNPRKEEVIKVEVKEEDDPETPHQGDSVSSSVSGTTFRKRAKQQQTPPVTPVAELKRKMKLKTRTKEPNSTSNLNSENSTSTFPFSPTPSTSISISTPTTPTNTSPSKPLHDPALKAVTKSADPYFKKPEGLPPKRVSRPSARLIASWGLEELGPQPAKTSKIGQKGSPSKKETGSPSPTKKSSSDILNTSYEDSEDSEDFENIATIESMGFVPSDGNIFNDEEMADLDEDSWGPGSQNSTGKSVKRMAPQYRFPKKRPKFLTGNDEDKEEYESVFEISHKRVETGRPFKTIDLPDDPKSKKHYYKIQQEGREPLLLQKSRKLATQKMAPFQRVVSNPYSDNYSQQALVSRDLGPEGENEQISGKEVVERKFKNAENARKRIYRDDNLLQVPRPINISKKPRLNPVTIQPVRNQTLGSVGISQNGRQGAVVSGQLILPRPQFSVHQQLQQTNQGPKTGSFLNGQKRPLAPGEIIQPRHRSRTTNPLQVPPVLQQAQQQQQQLQAPFGRPDQLENRSIMDVLQKRSLMAIKDNFIAWLNGELKLVLASGGKGSAKQLLPLYQVSGNLGVFYEP